MFGRGSITCMILLTWLIAAKQLSSYPTRENKSFMLLLCWTTQLIQYVPIHNKNPVTSWQCFEKHIFNTDLLLAKLQHRTQKKSSTDTDTLRKIDWHNMSSHTHHIVQCIPVTNKGRLSSWSPVSTRIYNRVTHCINCYSTALFTGTLVTINIWYTTLFNTAWKKINFKVGNMYTFKLIYILIPTCM